MAIDKIRRIFYFFYNLVPMVFKIWGIAFFMLILLVGALSWQVNTAVKNEFKKQLKNQGLAYAESIAKLSPDLIFTENYYGLYELVSSTQAQNNAIAYIFIQNPEGEVLVSTIAGGVPEELRNFNRIVSNTKYQIKRFNSPRGVVEDIAVPILNLRAGIVRIGILENSAYGFLRGINRTILFLGLVVALLGLIVSFLLAKLITQPIKKLIFSIKQVEGGNFNQPVELLELKDEVGELTNAFNDMLNRLNQAREELFQIENQRKLLLKKVIEAQEEERKRIARELHDEIGQALTSILISLKYLENHLQEEQKHLIIDIRNLASGTIDELKDLALSLRPSVLDNLGLLPALRNLIRYAENRYNFKISFYLEQPSHKIRNEAEISIYRVVQEALTNIARHANATRVRIVFREKGDKLLLKIADNGKGMALNVLSEKSLGLAGMRERITLLGGSFSLHSRIGKGTFIKICLPLKEVGER